MPVAADRLKEKRQALAARRVTFAAAFMGLMYDAQAQNDEISGSGIVFEEADFQGVTFNGVRLNQMDKALMDQSTTALNNIWNALRNNNWDDMFNAMKQ